MGVYFGRCWIAGEQMVINIVFFTVGAWAVWSHPDYSRGQRGDCTHRYHKELCVAGQFGWRIYSYYTGKTHQPIHLRCGAAINKLHHSLQPNCCRFGMMRDKIKLLSSLQGHMDELWGLAVHPWKPHFLTCGYDRQVCLWESTSHQLIWTKSMEVGLVNTALWGHSREVHDGAQLANSNVL